MSENLISHTRNLKHNKLESLNVVIQTVELMSNW